MNVKELTKGDRIVFRRAEAGPLFDGTFIRLDGACAQIEYQRPFMGKVKEFHLSSLIVRKHI